MMRFRKRPLALGFFGWVMLWVGSILALAVTHWAASWLLQGGLRRPWEIVFYVPGWIGILLPYSTFAGGAACSGRIRVPGIIKRAVPIAVLSYFLLAFGVPISTYLDHASAGADLTSIYPLGPDTPGTLMARRAAIRANPPEAFTFRIEQPLTRPPNWLSYLLLSSVATAGFSVLAGLLGHSSGKLTTGLSPPNRRNARWALGLGCSVAFFLAMAGGEDWVRSNPSNSGVLGAWLPLATPLVILGLLEALLWIRTREQPPPLPSGRG